MKLIIVIAVLITIQSYIHASRILILSPLGSKSHNNFLVGFAKPLSERGHHITFVSPYNTTVENENFTDVFLKTPSATSLLSNVFEQSLFSLVSDFLEKLPNLCTDSLASPEVQDLKKEEFDLIILSTFLDTCFLSLVHHFKVPLIYASPSEIYPPFSYSLGSFEIPSMVSNPFIRTSRFPFSFWDRFKIVTINTVFTTLDAYVSTPRLEDACRKKGLCPPDMPPFAQLNSNASLTLVNSFRHLQWPPRPEMPHIIYVGGGHFRMPKDLPKKLEDWINDSGEDGFIFFSLGSAVKPSDMPESYRKILLKVFASLKQRVLWKWDEETMDDLPLNVRLGKWLPQQDILAHPKLRLFITHGGLLSTMESTFFGIPIIGMPLFSDQVGNIANAASEGWALAMPWHKLKEDIFRNLIYQAIFDENLRNIAKRRSKLMRDVPRDPTQEAAYWIEYVLRHDGAEHLRSPLHHMPFYVLYNVDVYVTICGIAMAIILAEICLVKALFKRCTGQKKKKKKKKTK